MMKNADEMSSHKVEESQTTYNISNMGPIMQNSSAFFIVLTFACEALIACARQLDMMNGVCGDYGTILARSAKAIKLAIKEGRILGTRPFITFIQISHIIEKEIGSLEGGIYSLFFDSTAKSFLKYRNDEQMTANMWLTALTSANETISEINETSMTDRSMLAALISAENKLRDALNSGSNSIDAFGKAVKAVEAMQTMHTSVDSSKMFKYPGAHAVGIWMRAAYEGVKLKFDYKFDV